MNQPEQSILQKLNSRKLWAAILAPVAMWLAVKVGLPAEVLNTALAAIATIVVAYIGAQGHVDAHEAKARAELAKVDAERVRMESLVAPIPQPDLRIGQKPPAE